MISSAEPVRSRFCIFYIFNLGILLFSFPIYGRIIWGYSELSWLTPIGGICFFLAWSLISCSFHLQNNQNSQKFDQNQNYEQITFSVLMDIYSGQLHIGTV